jgi:hypothetical protein
MSVGSGRTGTNVQLAMRAAPRWKVPRVGERPSSSRKAAVARPSRCARLASARRDGGMPLSPRRSGQGTRDMLATRGIRSDRGWGEVSIVSSHGGERRESVFSRPLTLRTSSDCPGDRRVTFGRYRSRPNRLPRRFGMLEWSTVVLAGMSICRSRGSARGPESASEERANKGLVDVFRNTDEHVRWLPSPASGGSAPHPRSKGHGRWSSSAEVTSSFVNRRRH